MPRTLNDLRRREAPAAMRAATRSPDRLDRALALPLAVDPVLEPPLRLGAGVWPKAEEAAKPDRKPGRYFLQNRCGWSMCFVVPAIGPVTVEKHYRGEPAGELIFPDTDDARDYYDGLRKRQGFTTLAGDL